MQRLGDKSGGPENSANEWFAKRRDFFVTSMVQGFSHTQGSFLKIYQEYMGSGTVPYDKVDHLVGSENRKGRLWRLKDECHNLWSEADPASELNGCLLDWVIGSLFHEAMKLKENIYLFQFYGPMAKGIKVDGKVEMQKFCGFDCHYFMERVSAEISRQMENMGLMFGRANYLLRIMMPSLSGNCLLLRFLLEQRQQVQELWCESLEEIFADMFPEGAEKGFCLAGKSYFAGNWYDRAFAAYQEALQVNSTCDEALHRSFQLRAMLNKDEEELQERRFHS